MLPGALLFPGVLEGVELEPWLIHQEPGLAQAASPRHCQGFKNSCQCCKHPTTPGRCCWSCFPCPTPSPPPAGAPALPVALGESSRCPELVWRGKSSLFLSLCTTKTAGIAHGCRNHPRRSWDEDEEGLCLAELGAAEGFGSCSTQRSRAGSGLCMMSF